MTKEVKEFCETYGLTVEQFYGREVYKGTLDLSSLTELPEGFNPTIGGNLYLDSLKKYLKTLTQPLVGILI
ncbi:MAG: hypothetical protein M0R03_21850 [Novosphingobium sp.]|nr:hypothetical protein [Novosphingobium sp.]